MSDLNENVAFSVLTTVQAPTLSVAALARAGQRYGMPLLAVGDRKSPSVEWERPAEFLSLDVQKGMNSRLTKLLPLDHYSRKNMGYLEAIARGATVIFDTDDDNAPLPGWRRRNARTQARKVSNKGWVNVYRLFSSEFVWPRGLPLECLQECQRGSLDLTNVTSLVCPIQQGLVQGSPDVDALWRLLFDQELLFNDEPSVWLGPGTWCPFNSQSTWWFEDAFCLLYLPSFVTFRMTDIWRSFIAQRCLWELDCGIVFHSPESVQERNVHNLLHDFEEEISGYLHNNRIVSILERVQLSRGTDVIAANLHRCYEALVTAGIIPASELPLVEAWLSDLGKCRYADSLL
jgi:hypothetical protein